MSNISDVFFEKHLEEVPIILILRNLPSDLAVELARRAWNLGVRLVEVPLGSPDASNTLRALIKESKGTNELVGAGSIRTLDQLGTCADLELSFGVSPGVSAELAGGVEALKLAWLPGVASSSEIMLAESFGYTWLKAFPSQSLGADWFKAQLGPFPNISFVATGGVTSANATDWLNAGAVALGIGGGAADPESLTQIVKAVARR